MTHDARNQSIFRHWPKHAPIAPALKSYKVTYIFGMTDRHLGTYEARSRAHAIELCRADIKGTDDFHLSAEPVKGDA